MQKTIPLDQLRRNIIPIAESYGIRRMALFGSHARGTPHEGSDIDILVDFPVGKSLLDLVRLQRALKARLGREVDVVTYNSLNPLLRDKILEEQKVIYER